MGQSLVKNYLHIVFSTKHRFPFIHEPVENELHAYLGGICKNLECQPIKIGGYRPYSYFMHAFKKDSLNEAAERSEITFFQMDENKRR